MKRRILFALSLVGLFGGIFLAQIAFADSPIHTYNWAGYLEDTTTYTTVASSWSVPSMEASQNYTGSGQWIGIGGFHTNDLIQVGTRAISHNGSVRYTAWYELIPAPAVVVPLSVSPSDSVSATLREVSADMWEITLTNQTTGEHFSATVPYHSSHSSREWIQERPKGADGFMTLGAFSPVTFSTETEGGSELFMQDASGSPLASTQTFNNSVTVASR